MTVPQITIFLSAGSIYCEAPGLNGSRRKVNLPHDFAARNPEIAAELKVIEQTILANQERIRLASKIERPDPEVARQERIARERQERQARWNSWLASLSPAEQEYQIAKRDARLARAAEAELERSKKVWAMTATNHDVWLANRVITDPKRRPRPIGKLNSAQKRPQSKPAFNPALVVNIDL